MGGPVAEAQASSDTPPRPMQALPRDVPPVAAPAPAPVPQAQPDVPNARAIPPGGLPAGPLPPGVVRASAAGGEPGRRLTSAIRLPEGPAAYKEAGRKSAAPPAPLAFPRTEEGFFTIGRDSRCDLAIDHMTVSRIHARLERTPDGWMLKDL